MTPRHQTLMTCWVLTMTLVRRPTMVRARWKKNLAVLEHQLLLVQPVVASLLGVRSNPAALPDDQRDPLKLP